MSLQDNQQGLVHLFVVAAVLVAGIGATGYYVMKSQNSNIKSSETAAPSATSTLSAPLPTTLLSLDKVKDLATAQKSGLTIVGVELENENGVLTYKVKLTDGTAVNFNAQTGAVVTSSSKPEIEGQTSSLVNTSAKIDFAKARSIALAQTPKIAVRKIQLKLENGLLVYSVRFVDGSRIDVSAVDGSIVRTKAAGRTKTNDGKTDETTSSATDHASRTATDSSEIHRSGSSESSFSTSTSHDSPEAGSPTPAQGQTTPTDDSLQSGASTDVSGSSRR